MMPGDCAADDIFDEIHALAVGGVPVSLERRCSALLEDARSVIAAACCYARRPTVRHRPERNGECGALGVIAPYTRANFYRVLGSRLKRLVRRLGVRDRSRISVNGRNLPERVLAASAGLGGLGGNGLLVVAPYGSLVVIGIVLTTLPPAVLAELIDRTLPPGIPLRRPETALEPPAVPLADPGASVANGKPAPRWSPHCGACRACISACPTGALDELGRVDEARCIQALSAVDRVVEDEIMRAWGPRLYGCSACQDACPINAKVPPVGETPSKGRVPPEIELAGLLAMSEAEYRKRFAANQVAARWVPFRAVKRNALIAMGHSNLSRSDVNILASFAHSEDDVLSHTARWALRRAGKNEGEKRAVAETARDEGGGNGPPR